MPVSENDTEKIGKETGRTAGAIRRLSVYLLFLLVGLQLSGCAGKKENPAGEAELSRYEETYFTVFDTVTVIKGYAKDEASFQEEADAIFHRLETYHQLFDIYEDYPGITNLKVVNEKAGEEAVAVDDRIMDLLLFARDLAEETNGKVDVTLGSVLFLWHEAREAGIADEAHAFLPDEEALREAAAHCGFDKVELDEEEGTVRFLDPSCRLDVGAVAKGYAVQKACEEAPSGYLVSVGGNVFATGAKPSGAAWTVGIQTPDEETSSFDIALNVQSGAVVTSGDYQRYYTVDGVRYHHIIDPETGVPATKWKSTTVVCEDSAVADGLSTALFLMEKEEAMPLLEKHRAEALWMDAEGNISQTDGFLAMEKK